MVESTEHSNLQRVDSLEALQSLEEDELVCAIRDGAAPHLVIDLAAIKRELATLQCQKNGPGESSLVNDKLADNLIGIDLGASQSCVGLWLTGDE